jgi:hypothetical protein
MLGNILDWIHQYKVVLHEIFIEIMRHLHHVELVRRLVRAAQLNNYIIIYPYIPG